MARKYRVTLIIERSEHDDNQWEYTLSSWTSLAQRFDSWDAALKYARELRDRINKEGEN
jgi:hypothetical protein